MTPSNLVMMPSHPPDGITGTNGSVPSAHIIGSQLLGGAELFYARLVNALPRRGHPTLAVISPNSLIASELCREIPIVPIPMRGIWDLGSRWQIRKMVEKHRPEIVQTYMGRATRLTRFPSGRQPIHVARLGGYYHPRGYRHAHAWVVANPGICDHLLRHGFPVNRIFHISNFVAPCDPMSATESVELRRTFDIPTDALIVTAVGRLHPVKGFDDLLKAFTRVPACVHGRPVYLIVVGNGPLAARLPRYANQLGVGHRVRWPGWRNDAGRFQELADLCVCSSRQEGLGNVILEAWARSRAVLSTQAQGPMDIMTHRESGWLVPIGDSVALATAMELLLADDSLRHELATTGKRVLLAHHSEKAITNAYLELYQHLLAI